MPFQRPTLTQLRAQVSADIAASIEGATAPLRFSNLGITGDVQAALASGLYGYLDYIALQAVPFTATGEYLEGWAGLKGVIRKPAAAASATAVFSGTNGTSIPNGTPVTRSGDGAAYVVVQAGVIFGGEATVTIAAVSPGAAGNGPSGSAVTLTQAIAGVSPNGMVVTAFTGGADAEVDDSLRSRMLAAYASPAQGGDIADYKNWALAVPGVTRAWVKPGGAGIGTVVVYFMMDIAEAAGGGFPVGTDGCAAAETRGPTAAGDQLTVANAIYPPQPVTALVYLVAPRPNTLNFTISGLSAATSIVKNAVKNAIATALAVEAAPGGTNAFSTIEVAIGAVPGTTGFVVTQITASNGTVSGIAGNIVSDPGYLPVLGVVSWT